MADIEIPVDTDRATATLLRFLEIEGVTGHEKAIGKAVVAALAEAGVPKKYVKFDEAHTLIPVPTQTGNLIVTLPGTRDGARLLFSTHLDTVPLCAGAKPLRKGNRIVADSPTALGGDDRTGVACLVTLAATLFKEKPPHPPLTLLFTVREESGLWGARYVKPEDLGNPVMGYNVDGKAAAELTVGAVGADRWEAHITGKASHAGVHPEKGVSATMIAALAMAEIRQGGWFGRIVKGENGEQTGTSNVGSVGDAGGRSAGNATNVVTDFCLVKGESRSHDPKFVKAITAAYKQAFQVAVASVTDDKGKSGKVKFSSQLDYSPFKINDDAPVVRRALRAAERVGMKPVLRSSNGGLDANWLVKHGIPTVTFGAGQNNIHTTDEYVDLTEFAAGCRLAAALATSPD